MMTAVLLVSILGMGAGPSELGKLVCKLWLWDLIVSVPDHCLSFYSGNGEKLEQTKSASNTKEFNFIRT